MEWMLDFDPEPLTSKISYHSKCMLIGSCFTEQIGNRLQQLKFNILQNPSGIIYDPFSMTDTVRRIARNKIYTDDDLFFHNELWHSRKHHSRFSGVDKQKVLSQINTSLNAAHEFILSADWLMVTLGTSYYYSLAHSGEKVANCHKVPSNNFLKNMASVQEITENLSVAFQKIRSINTDIKFLLTVSPVRHIKDGVIENNISKGRLINAVHELTRNISNCFYFPAYELVIDVLRDYRFYEKDLVHPNALAEDFVFEKFSETCMDTDTREIMEEIKKWVIAEHHRPFNTETSSYKKFREDQHKKLEILKIKYPFINY